VGNHTADSLVEDSGRSAEMERTRLLGVNQVTLVEVVVVAELESTRERERTRVSTKRDREWKMIVIPSPCESDSIFPPP